MSSVKEGNLKPRKATKRWRASDENLKKIQEDFSGPNKSCEGKESYKWEREDQKNSEDWSADLTSSPKTEEKDKRVDRNKE